MGPSTLTAALLAEGNKGAAESMAAHCDVAATLAERLGLGPSLYEPMRQLFARWDGKGEPRLRGDAIAAVRFGSSSSLTSSRRIAARRAGGGAGGRADSARAHSSILRSSPSSNVTQTTSSPVSTRDDLGGGRRRRADPVGPLAEDELDEALRGRRRLRGSQVAVLPRVTRAAWQLSRRTRPQARDCAERRQTTVRRAALLHDLGRTGVPNSIWDKPGALTESERERVRLHPYYTERALARPAALARLGAIAGAHHERLDGSGYHRGLTGAASLAPARVLAAPTRITR